MITAVFQECNCERVVWRRRRTGSGLMSYGHWCEDCGRWWRRRKEEIPEGIDPDDLEFEDPEVRQKHWQRKREFYEERRYDHQTHVQRVNDAKKSLYDQYMQSESWAAKRAAVLKRDPICKACGVAPSQQAHHLTYDRFGDEPLFDLIGVCIPCHQKIHNHDPEKCLCTSCRLKVTSANN